MQNPPPSGYGYPQGYGPQGYGPPQGFGPRPPQQGPPPHPYATASLVLGLSSLGLGPLTGVAAILLGAKALREIKAGPQPFSGAGSATAGRIFGWIGCVFGALYAGSTSGRSSIGLAVVVGLLGLAGTAAAVAGAINKNGPLASVPLASVAVTIALTLGSISGVTSTRAEAAQKAEVCTKNTAEIATRLAKNAFAGARSALSSAKASCDPSAGGELALHSRQIDDQERAWKKSEDERVAAKRAADAQKKEEDAVATWPVKSTAIASGYRKAANDLAIGKFADADTDLQAAENMTAEFAGTSIADSKAWKDLGAQELALRKRVDAQLAVVAKAQAAKAAAAALADEQTMLRNILAQYKDNEVRGDALYKGKTVQFSGIVDDVKKDFTNNIYVTVGSGEWLQIPQIQCFFDDSAARQTAQLSKGDRVRMRGTVKGLMMNVLVEACEIVQ
jgi:tRNA_anti-like/Domain of unknown function (DUF4190)